MHEIIGDLFDSVRADAICITTNGYVNSQGANTMGRGCAGEAKRRWPGIQMLSGQAISEGGNHVHLLTLADQEGSIHLPSFKGWPVRSVPYHILTFPTKPASITDPSQMIRQSPHQAAEHLISVEMPGWIAKSDPLLIEQSARELVELTNRMGWSTGVVLPRPGCGAGELNWETDVHSRLSLILDDRFYVITYQKG